MLKSSFTYRATGHPATVVLITAALTLLAGCGPIAQFDPAPEHLQTAVPRGEIPQTVTQIAVPPPPVPAPRPETYSVVVTDVPVRDVLFALSRDARVNVDITGDIRGNITMNAIDQTLPQILDRISRQVSLRYQLDNGSLIVSADEPFWRNYRVDYVNLARGSEGEVTVATQVATTGLSNVGGEGGESVAIAAAATSPARPSGASATTTSGRCSRTTSGRSSRGRAPPARARRRLLPPPTLRALHQRPAPRQLRWPTPSS